MNGMFRNAVAVLALTVGMGGWTAASAEPLTLSFSAFSASSSPNHRLTVDKMIQDIEAASGGQVKFETYFGGSAYGNAQRQFDQVQRGLVDVSHGMFG